VDLPVAKVGVHRGPDGEPGDEPPAGDDVQHRELLGHSNGRVVAHDRVYDHAEGGARGLASERRGDQVRRRHQSIPVLVVLVAAEFYLLVATTATASVSIRVGSGLAIQQWVLVERIVTQTPCAHPAPMPDSPLNSARRDTPLRPSAYSHAPGRRGRSTDPGPLRLAPRQRWRSAVDGGQSAEPGESLRAPGRPGCARGEGSRAWHPPTPAATRQAAAASLFARSPRRRTAGTGP